MKKTIILTIITGLLPINSFANKIYHCEDATGKKSFQSFPCKDVTIKIQERSVTPTTTKTENDNSSSCTDEVDKNLAWILKEINDYYDKRTSQCKKYYASGTSHRKNCLQEQDEIKQDKINKYYEPKKKSLNNC